MYYSGVFDEARAKELWAITEQAAKDHGIKLADPIYPVWVDDCATKKVRWTRINNLVVQITVTGLPLDIPNGIFKEFLDCSFRFLAGEEPAERSPELIEWVDSHRRLLVPIPQGVQ